MATTQAEGVYKRFQQGSCVLSGLLSGQKVQQCRHCEQEFTADRKRTYCTERCRYRAAERRKGSVPRSEYLAKVRENAASKFTCEHCGKEAFRKLGGASKVRNYGNRFCSMACRVGYQAVEREAKEGLSNARKSFLRILKQIAKAKQGPTRAFIPRVRTCPCCQLQWSATRQVGPTDYCHTPACQAERKKAKRSRSGKTHTGRAKRMGRKYGYFNIMRVFERDKWTCQICGVKTPKELRGSMDPRAPELDHILALALGGDHLIENCQCACRKCNGEKGAGSKGQMWLAGFADTITHP